MVLVYGTFTSISCPRHELFVNSVRLGTTKCPGRYRGTLSETVEKVADATFSSRSHEISGSISCEIVAQNFVRGVISQAHVLGNDWISFYSAACGRRNSLQEGFFDTLRQSAPADTGALCLCVVKREGE